jgi:hypothetical protein
MGISGNRRDNIACAIRVDFWNPHWLLRERASILNGCVTRGRRHRKVLSLQSYRLECISTPPVLILARKSLPITSFKYLAEGQRYRSKSYSLGSAQKGDLRRSHYSSKPPFLLTTIT